MHKRIEELQVDVENNNLLAATLEDQLQTKTSEIEQLNGSLCILEGVSAINIGKMNYLQTENQKCKLAKDVIHQKNEELNESLQVEKESKKRITELQSLNQSLKEKNWEIMNLQTLNESQNTQIVTQTAYIAQLESETGVLQLKKVVLICAVSVLFFFCPRGVLRHASVIFLWTVY